MSGYLDQLKKKEMCGGALPGKDGKSPSAVSAGTPTPSHKVFSSDDQGAVIRVNQAQILSISPSGNDISPANDADDQAARLKALPSDLVSLAIRYCVEQYGDSPDQVREMLEDLLAAPNDWHWWRIHFMKKLRIQKEVQCIDCGHCEDTAGNLGRCLKAMPSPGAGGLWWMTDQHPCIEFSPKEAA